MSKNIITISREFGSGGLDHCQRSGKKVGNTNDDKRVVKQILMETGFSEGFVEENGEMPARNWLALDIRHYK